MAPLSTAVPCCGRSTTSRMPTPTPDGAARRSVSASTRPTCACAWSRDCAPRASPSRACSAAFAAVPRHLFVDAALATQAYEDTSLPIGHGQTISKPSVVARMLELLLDGAAARERGDLGAVLEIGTGCGYQAALLAEAGRRVVSVERIQPLHDKARALLAPMRGAKIRLVLGDGTVGHAPGAPYDSIIAAAGAGSIPAAWLEQLAVGGRLVAPVHQPGRGQVLVVVDRRVDGYSHGTARGGEVRPLKIGTRPLNKIDPTQCP